MLESFQHAPEATTRTHKPHRQQSKDSRETHYLEVSLKRANMDFHDLGKHCSAENCNQQDFLPFICNGCRGTFCLEHRTYAGHDCRNADFNEKRVLECPSCNSLLKSIPDVPDEVALQRHLASGCKEGVRRKRSNKVRCSAPGCRSSEFVKISCKSCRKNFCLRHRHDDDHGCSAIQNKARKQGGATAPARTHFRIKGSAGAAAATATQSTACGTEARSAEEATSMSKVGGRVRGKLAHAGAGSDITVH